MENELETVLFWVWLTPVPIPVLIYQQDNHFYNKGAIHLDIHQNL